MKLLQLVLSLPSLGPLRAFILSLASVFASSSTIQRKLPTSSIPQDIFKIPFLNTGCGHLTYYLSFFCNILKNFWKENPVTSLAAWLQWALWSRTLCRNNRNHCELLPNVFHRWCGIRRHNSSPIVLTQMEAILFKRQKQWNDIILYIYLACHTWTVPLFGLFEKVRLGY